MFFSSTKIWENQKNTPNPKGNHIHVNQKKKYMYIYIYIIHLSKCLRQNVFKIKVFASKERKMLIINSIHLGFQTWWVESANFNELFCLFEKMISPKYLKKWTSCLETSCTSRSFQVNWSIASDISRKKTILTREKLLHSKPLKLPPPCRLERIEISRAQQMTSTEEW